MGEGAGSRSVGKLLKKWIDTGKECLRIRGLNAGKPGEWCRGL